MLRYVFRDRHASILVIASLLLTCILLSQGLRYVTSFYASLVSNDKERFPDSLQIMLYPGEESGLVGTEVIDENGSITIEYSISEAEGRETLRDLMEVFQSIDLNTTFRVPVHIGSFGEQVNADICLGNTTWYRQLTKGKYLQKEQMGEQVTQCIIGQSILEEVQKERILVNGTSYHVCGVFRNYDLFSEDKTILLYWCTMEQNEQNHVLDAVLADLVADGGIALRLGGERGSIDNVWDVFEEKMKSTGWTYHIGEMEYGYVSLNEEGRLLYLGLLALLLGIVLINLSACMKLWCTRRKKEWLIWLACGASASQLLRKEGAVLSAYGLLAVAGTVIGSLLYCFISGNTFLAAGTELQYMFLMVTCMWMILLLLLCPKVVHLSKSQIGEELK